jgi:hypothetical protein
LLLFVDTVETKQIIAPVLNTLVGVANVATSPDWQQRASRLVDILVNGSRSTVRGRSNSLECGPLIEVRAIVLSVEILF